MGSGADNKESRTGSARLNEIPGNEKVHIETAPKCPGKPPLDNTGIRGLMAAIETQGNILVIQAEIEGMKVSNAELFASGHTTPDYREVDFKDKADQIKQHVSWLHVVRNSLMK